MLLPYDSDMINRIKIILNTISTFNYKKIKKNVNVFHQEKFNNVGLSFSKTYVKIIYNNNRSPDSSVGRAVD